ncbi:polyhydroxyalkanoate synthesis repressor PhaR [Polycladidibacter stylochi]|uniref:polyhydroxyalkanoate synthesis repressor PhaR n=1 Tax=Polycladidibacter stylochi TaxID=1807766 RepID=UPI0008344389|nr:polyhydroxyalkanoate synthesis repressor PhaR [Pseudovibrio stylochi]
MVAEKEAIVIKKYANRRLYNTGTSAYVTLEDLALMVKAEEDFVVVDAKTGEDLTRTVLTQIIVEQESKGQNLLPVTFLRQLIRFYGDSMQNLVPSYLEYSMASLTKEQERMREQISHQIGSSAFEMMEDHVKRNTEMFNKAMNMFVPLSTEQESSEPKTAAQPTNTQKQPQSGELDELKQQLAKMQKQISDLANKGS